MNCLLYALVLNYLSCPYFCTRRCLTPLFLNCLLYAVTLFFLFPLAITLYVDQSISTPFLSLRHLSLTQPQKSVARPISNKKFRLFLSKVKHQRLLFPPRKPTIFIFILSRSQSSKLIGTLHQFSFSRSQSAIDNLSISPVHTPSRYHSPSSQSHLSTSESNSLNPCSSNSLSPCSTTLKDNSISSTLDCI